MLNTDYEYEKYEKLRDYKRHHVISNNEYRVEGNTVYVTIVCKDEVYTMLCDLEDWNILKDYKWHRETMWGYAVTNAMFNGKRTSVRFHQVIMGQKKGLLIDHINRNTLDNRKENLRFVPQNVNGINKGLFSNNKSGYPGVSWRKDHNRWRATIKHNGKQVDLGSYVLLEDAIRARKEAEEKYYKPLLEKKYDN